MRLRNKRVTLRIEAKTLALMEKQFAKAGITWTDFVSQCAVAEFGRQIGEYLDALENEEMTRMPRTLGENIIEGLTEARDYYRARAAEEGHNFAQMEEGI